MSDVGVIWVGFDGDDTDVSTYRLTEIVGTAPGSVDQAIASGVARAGRSVHCLGWFQVGEIRGSIHGACVERTQVTMELGFRVLDVVH